LTLACGSGAVVCGLLALTGGNEWLLAGLLFVAGSTIEGISDLAWNGMLPELAPPGDRDAVSSRGTAIGHLGAGILLVVSLLLVDLHSDIGIEKATAVRLCFLLAGMWWAGFGWRAIRRLDPPSRRRSTSAGATSPARSSFGLVRSTLRLLASMPHARRYVVAYLLFADAFSAVISLASTFLTHQLFDDNTTKATPFLFELILMIQFVAVFGALGFARLARRYSAKWALFVGLVIWVAVIVFAYAVLKSELDAVIAGFFIGVTLGGTTALSRSLFAQMIPAGSEATWFGIYEVCSQGTAWVAPLLFTIVVDVTGSFRQALLSLVILFVAGGAVLAFVDADEAAREARAAILEN
jgi:UMF1 family MFS transporter